MKEIGGEAPQEIPKLPQVPRDIIVPGGTDRVSARQWWEWRTSVDPVAFGHMQQQLEGKAQGIAEYLRKANIPQTDIWMSTLAGDGAASTTGSLWVCHMKSHTSEPYGAAVGYTYIKGLGFTDTGALYTISGRPTQPMRSVRATAYDLIVPPPDLDLGEQWRPHMIFPYASDETLTSAVIDASYNEHWGHIRDFAEEKLGYVPRLP